MANNLPDGSMNTEDPRSPHYDTTADEADEANIQAGIDGMKQDWDAVIGIILETYPDIVRVAIDCNIFDQEAAIKEILEDAMRVQVRDNLNLD